jgi:GNAT superfamily N-acetyltransferase
MDGEEDGMDLEQFAEWHVPALEGDDVRFNLLIAVIPSAVNEKPAGFRYWTLGGPGHCAIQWPGRAIVLGNLDRDECGELARTTIPIEYPGVVGSDETPRWFVQQAAAMGADFEEPIPQRIHVLSEPPRYPGVPGSARAVRADDAPLLFEWLVAFHDEAVPHDPPPRQADIEKAAASGRFLFWTVDDVPVSVAAIARRLRHVGAVSSVYTPPGQRGRGYAGSATAAVVEQLFAEGKSAACLYTARDRDAAICAILRRTAVMPGSASGRTATPGIICGAPRQPVPSFRHRGFPQRSDSVSFLRCLTRGRPSRNSSGADP